MNQFSPGGGALSGDGAGRLMAHQRMAACLVEVRIVRHCGLDLLKLSSSHVDPSSHDDRSPSHPSKVLITSPPMLGVNALHWCDADGAKCVRREVYGSERGKTAGKAMPRVDQLTTGFRYGSAVHEPISFRKPGAEAAASREDWGCARGELQRVTTSCKLSKRYHWY
jgi:hypothetical protein